MEVTTDCYLVSCWICRRCRLTSAWRGCFAPTYKAPL